jgi:hypothetical protein
MLMSAASWRRWWIFISFISGPRGPGAAFSATPMSTVPSMHEHVKQGAGEQEQKWQVPEEMRPMLGDQIKSGNHKKCDQHDVCARPATARW